MIFSLSLSRLSMMMMMIAQFMHRRYNNTIPSVVYVNIVCRCVVFGWHNAWLALSLSCSSLSDCLSVCGGSASIVLCTKLTNERNEPTKAVDVVQIKMLCCEEEEACYVVMLCYAMLCAPFAQNVSCASVRACVRVCVGVCGTHIE